MPMPEPYLKMRASRTQRSMMPPSLTRSSLTRLDEAGVRLRALVGVGAALQLAGLGIDVVVALGGAFDAVGEVEAGVEPLRAVGRGHLAGEHVARLVVERLGVVFGVEVAVLPAPVGPAAGEAVEDLAGVGFAAVALVFGELR